MASKKITTAVILPPTLTVSSASTWPTTNADAKTFLDANIVFGTGSGSLWGFRRSYVAGGPLFEPSAIKPKFLVNAGTSVWVVYHDNASAPAEERIYTSGGENMQVAPGDVLVLNYDSNVQRWRVSKIPAQAPYTRYATSPPINHDIRYQNEGVRLVYTNHNLRWDLDFFMKGTRGMMRVYQDGGGGKNVTSWTTNNPAGTVRWASGTPPTLSSAPNAIDIIEWWYDGDYVHAWPVVLNSQ